MTRLLHTLPFLAFGFWIVLLVQSTHFFYVLTWEDERQLAIAQTQPDAAFLRVTDVQGEFADLSALAREHKKPYIVEFVYTQCRSLCLVLGNTFQQVQSQIVQKDLANQLGLMSVSFDIEQDDQQALIRYQSRMHADPNIWLMLTMADNAVLEQATAHLGLIVLEDGAEYTHNSAYLVLSATGRVIGLFAIDDINGAIALALTKGQVSADEQ